MRDFRTRPIGIATATLWGVLLASGVNADTLVMNNGDRLSGEVLLMDDGVLVLKTDYAGEIRIDWDKVAQLRTDDPMLLRAQGLPAEQEALLAPAGREGRIAVLQPDAAMKEDVPTEVALTDIERIVRPHAFLRDWNFTGNVDLSMGASHSTSTNQNWSAAMNVTARRDWWRHNLTMDYARKTQDSIVGTYNYNGAYTMDRFLSEKFFLRARLRHGRDRIANPSRQSVFAAGPGYQFWDNELGAFSMSAFLTHTRYKYHDDARDNFQTAGLSWNFTRYLAGKQWQVFTAGEVHRAFSGASDYSLETEIGLRYSVTQWMSLYAKAGYDHLTLSGKPSTRERQYSVGLGVHW